MADAMLSEPDDKKNLFLQFNDPSFDGMLKIFTPAVAEEILTCEKQTLTVSVHPICYTIWPLEVILKT
jgi:hypothetical protein